jgi:TonB family protein
MKIRTKKNIFFQNAFILSTIAHGGAIIFLAYWTTNNKSYVPKVEAIQIKTIIYESSLTPKIEKKHYIKPVEEISAKVNRLLPAKTQPHNGLNQFRPIPKKMTSISKRIVSLPTNNPKPIRPFIAKSTEPAYFQKGMLANEIQQPNNSVQYIQVTKLNVASALFSPSPAQTGKFDNTIRRSHSSVESARALEKVTSNKELLQGTKIAKVSRRFYKVPIPGPNIGAKNIHTESNFWGVSDKPNQEVRKETRTLLNNRIQPVQLASIPTEFVGASKEGKLEENLEPATSSDLPKVGVGSPQVDLDSLRKGFSSGVWEKISKAKFYPRIAQDQGWEGKPVVEFQLGRNGDLLSYSIAVASPYEILNQAAIDAVKKASPYPEIPETFKANSIRLKLPISFKLD